MSDDAWRRGRRDDDDDFGPPLFSDDPTGEVHDLSFGSSDTGPLPHWTQPPTGEMPRVLSSQSADDPTDDLDVWSSFSSQSPVWRDDPPADATAGRPAADPSAGYRTDVTAGAALDDTHADASAPVRREPGRITIGTDPTDGASRSAAAPRRGRPGEPVSRSARPGRPSSPGRPGVPPPGRDMPTAVAVGLLLAAAFVGAVMWRPLAVLLIIVLVLGFGTVEFFDKVTEKGYRPATIVALFTAVGIPIAVYWGGVQAMPLVLVVAFAAACITFVAAPSLESAPLPNVAVTMLGVVWIGVMGSYAALILRLSNHPVEGFTFHNDLGTDTLFLLVLGVVANDIGALVLGSAVGRTPLRAWISPGKTVEGFIGGTLATMIVLAVVGFSDKSDTWNSPGDLLLMAIVISLFAPLGDLTESMFKRNLDVKDFGSIVKGHGGVLDRFDGFLFTLPAVYYLFRVLQPYVS